MAALTVQQPTRTGAVITTATPTVTTGDTFANDGKVWLRVANGSGSSINVTVTAYAAALPGLVASNNVVAVAAGAAKDIGPFPPSGFTDPSTGLATVVCSAVTTVTIAALRYAAS